MNVYAEIGRLHPDWRNIRVSSDVRTVVKETGFVLVTAIQTYGHLGPFRPIMASDFQGIRVFDILLRPGQIVAASSVGPTDTAENLYGRWGAIVADGEIVAAFPYDAVTSTDNGKVRSRFSGRLEAVPLIERIHHALYSRIGYNEIDVRVRSIAGLYYSMDGSPTLRGDRPSDRVMEWLDPFELPLYALSGGKFYRMAHHGDAIDAVTRGVATQIHEIIEHPYALSTQQKNRILDILTNTLVLAPRNPITSGLIRGQHAYLYRRSACSYIAETAEMMREFLTQHKTHSVDQNPAIRLYAAMALYAFGDTALQCGDPEIYHESAEMASKVLPREQYRQYCSRVVASGHLHVTKDDVVYYMQHGGLPPYLSDH